MYKHTQICVCTHNCALMVTNETYVDHAHAEQIRVTHVVFTLRIDNLSALLMCRTARLKFDNEHVDLDWS